MKKILVLLGIFLFPFQAFSGEFNIGGQLWAWSTNFVPQGSGTELYVPAFVSVDANQNLSFYGQSELGTAGYTIPYTSHITAHFTELSDSNVGAKFRVATGPVRPFVNLGVNLNTGNENYRIFQIQLPSDFVDPRYQGVTFGISVLGGVKLPDGSGEYGLEAGYMSPGVFNTTFDIPQGNMLYSQYADTFLLSADYSQDFQDGSSQAFGAWALYHDTTNVSGIYRYQYGPNFDLYYRWKNPAAFSMEAGFKYFLPSQSAAAPSGSLAAEPDNSRGPRLYLNPSYATGQVTFDGQVSCVFPNGYPQTDINYDGGGWLLGIGPVWRIPAGDKTTFKLSAAYNKIILSNAVMEVTGTFIDIDYDLFKLGAEYEVDF